MADHHIYLSTTQCEIIEDNDDSWGYLYTLPWELDLQNKQWEMAILEAEIPSATQNEYFYVLCDLVEKNLIFGEYLPFLRKFRFFKKKKVLEGLTNPYYFKIRSHIKTVEQLRVYIAFPQLHEVPVAVKRPSLKFLFHIREKQ